MSSNNAQNGYGSFDQFAQKVVDPEDYNRTQRFKEIHQARQRVTEHMSQMELPESGAASYMVQESTRLAHLVSIYILELEPLIIQSDLDDSELLSENAVYDSLLDFAYKMGVKPGKGTENRTPSPQEIVQYFSAANRFYARVGMDLDLAEDEGDASFDYSDILQEGPPGEGEFPEIEQEAESE